MLVVKNLPANAEMQETWVLSLGQKDPLKDVMATHSSILAWRIPWTQEGVWRATVRGISEESDILETKQQSITYYETCFLKCI